MSLLLWFRPRGKPFDYYVDENATPGGDGLTEGSAFDTLADFYAVAATGDRVGLAKGSHFRESLAIGIGDGITNLTFGAYGSGAKPIIDGSDIALNASFSKTGGQTNVYEIAVTVETGVTDARLLVCEDDTMLVYQSSIANVDANAGSYYMTGSSGSITFYVHASDSSDVTANGKLYEYSSRGGVLDLYHADGSMLNGIEMRMPLGGAGAYRGCKNGYIYDCEMNQCGKHNTVYRPNTKFENCSFTDVHTAGGTSSIMASYNDTDFNGETVELVNCTFFISENLNTNVNAVHGHQNNTGTLSKAAVSGCTFENFVQPFAGVNHCDALEIRNCTFTNCTRNSIAGTDLVTLIFSNCSWDSDVAVQRALSMSGSYAATISDYYITTRNRTDATGYLYITGSVNATLRDITFDEQYGTSTRVGINVDSASVILDMQGLTFLNVWQYPFQFDAAASGMTWSSDYNQFPTDGELVNGYDIFGTTYATFAAYQAAVTPRDANSTTA